MSPKTKTQLNSQKEVKREAILHASLHLFAEKGIFKTSISDIAKKAGISKGLVYNYFDSKEKLLNAVYENGFKEITDVFDPDHDGVLSCDEMEFFIVNLLKNLKENREHWKLYFILMVQQPDMEELIKGEMANKALEIFRVIEKYLETCGFEDPKAELQALHLLFDGMFFNYAFNPSLVDLDVMEGYLKNKYCKNIG